MTTNQTIDGVPLEAFKWAMEQLEQDGNKGCGYFDSLRALLDADKVNNRQMGLMQFVEAHPIKPAEERGSSHGFEQSPNTCRHDERSGVWWREGSITRTGRECCACGSVEEDPVKQAAQPQGDPVARQPDAIIEGVMTSVGISHAIYASTVTLKHGEQVKLYAEQPAPVAVVLPEEMVPVRRDWLEEWAMELVLAAQDGGTMSNQVEHLLQRHPKL